MSYRHIHIWYKMILGGNMVLGDFGTLDKCYDVFYAISQFYGGNVFFDITFLRVFLMT